MQPEYQTGIDLPPPLWLERQKKKKKERKEATYRTLRLWSPWRAWPEMYLSWLPEIRLEEKPRGQKWEEIKKSGYMIT